MLSIFKIDQYNVVCVCDLEMLQNKIYKMQMRPEFGNKESWDYTHHRTVGRDCPAAGGHMWSERATIATTKELKNTSSL